MFPGMQVPPGPYYPGNMKWPPPPNMEDLGDRESDRNHRSRRSKKKHSNGKVREASEEEESESSYESESEEAEEEEEEGRHAKKASRKKKHAKKASRKVVIRNINYISAKKDGETGSGSEEEDSDEEYLDGDSIKQQVEEAVGSLERRHKSSRRHKKQGSSGGSIKYSNGDQEAKSAAAENTEGEKKSNPWDAFQNLLMRDEEPSNFEEQPRGAQDYFAQEGKGLPALSFEQEKIVKQRLIASDDFMVMGRETRSERNSQAEYFEGGANVVKKQHGPGEEFLLSHEDQMNGNSSRVPLPDSVNESSKLKCPKDGEWFLGNQQDVNPGQSKDPNLFDGVYSSSSSFQADRNKRDVVIDDSFMVQDRFTADQFDYFMRTDISMVPEIIGASNGAPETSQDEPEPFTSHEPDDLFMMLDRDSGVEQSMASWTPEMDYNNSISLAEANKKAVETETTEFVEANQTANSKAKTGKSNGVPGKTKPDLMSRAKRPGLTSRTTGPKSKLEKVFMNLSLFNYQDCISEDST